MIRRKIGFTLIEVMIGMLIMIMLLLAVYKFFFAKVRTIRFALEHAGINENVRLFFSQFGNDVRNSNWLEYPPASVREGVPKILPSLEGKLCVMGKQVFDFSVKPPDPSFLKIVKIEWHMKRAFDGTFDLYRTIHSDLPAYPTGQAPYTATRKICGGVKEFTIFSSVRRPVKLTSFPGLPYKNFLVYDPYDIDGTGTHLVHVRVVFVKQNQKIGQEETPFVIRTCFAMRGRMNGVNP